MDLNALLQNGSATLMGVAWKLAGALALWLVGRWLIGFALTLHRSTRGRVEPGRR